MVAPLNSLSLAAEHDGKKRIVFAGEEHSEIGVPLDALLSGASLKVYPEVSSRNFFRVFLRDDRLVFQAASFIGLIPVNDELAIEVRTRVPVNNLERLLAFAQEYSPEVLPRYHKGYTRSAEATPSLLSILSERLLGLLERLQLFGWHHGYAPVLRVSQQPRGRILPFASARYRAKRHPSTEVVSSAYERTIDTPPNQCVRAAIQLLLKILSATRNRPQTKALLRRLHYFDAVLEKVGLDASQSFLHDPLVADAQKLASGRPEYAEAVALARTIILQGGVVIRSSQGPIQLPSILIDMEKVFEAYLRRLLQRRSAEVLDGNLSAPSGAKRKLFTSADPLVAGNPATPDIVVQDGSGQTRLIVEVKYKKLKNSPEREDVNQTVTYANVYGCSTAVIALPKREGGSAGLFPLGMVGSVWLFMYVFDLAAPDLLVEEREFVDTIMAL